MDEITNFVDLLVDAAFDSGYYQATMEKANATLTDEQLREYAKLNLEAIGKRKILRQGILDVFAVALD